jgi:hypothetical protein
MNMSDIQNFGHITVIFGSGQPRHIGFVKNVVFWDIKPQFVPHRRHITSPLQSPAGWCYVRFEVFTEVTMKNIVFWDIKTQFVPHRRHITSPIWGFHGGDYEESRLLGYKNPVLTSQETYYISTTEPSGLILYKIRGLPCGDYEQCRPLGCDAAWILYEPTSRRNVSSPSWGW